MLQLIIANTLTDGFVVFLTETGEWSADIAAGAVVDTETAAEKLLATAKQKEQQNEVIDPYLIEIEVKDGQRIPTEYREFIRASGPTVPIPS